MTASLSFVMILLDFTNLIEISFLLMHILKTNETRAVTISHAEYLFGSLSATLLDL